VKKYTSLNLSNTIQWACSRMIRLFFISLITSYLSSLKAFFLLSVIFSALVRMYSSSEYWLAILSLVDFKVGSFLNTILRYIEIMRLLTVLNSSISEWIWAIILATDQDRTSNLSTTIKSEDFETIQSLVLNQRSISINLLRSSLPRAATNSVPSSLSVL